MINKHLVTNAKIHFACVARAGGVRYLDPQNLLILFNFDGLEYFVNFTRMK